MNRESTIVNEAISASAGTGKTYSLAVRYIRLLGAGVSPDSITAMTFTRKAAGEILDRIIVLICEWIIDRARFEKEFTEKGYREMQHRDLPALLHDLLQNIHKLKISTLDSFYVSIIKSFPFEFGLNGDFQIVDTSVEEEAKMTVLREILWHEVDEKNKQSFLADFKQATYGSEEKSILKNMKNFIDDHHGVFLLAGNEEIWGNPDLIWKDHRELFSGKIEVGEHCAALRGLFSGVDLSPKQSEMLNDFITETSLLEINYRLHSKNAKSTFTKLLEVIDDIREGEAVITLDRKKIVLDKQQCLHFEKIIAYIIRETILLLKEQTCGLYQILKRYESTYDYQIRRNGLFTFRDVLHQLSLHAIDERFPVLSNSPQVDKLYIDYRLDSRFDHWLLDEFQDTNYLQWKVIENLIDEVMQDLSGRRSFFYVGDIKQSIYQWRSGDPRLFNAVFEKFDHSYGNIVKIPLMKSYRSNSEITETVNKVFTGIKGNEDLESVFPEVVDRLEWELHESAKGEGGFAGLIGMDKIKDETDEESVARKAEVIAEQINKVNPLARGLKVAILVRQHKSGALFAKELNRLGIKTTISSRHNLCDNPLVASFISLIMLAEHPQDEYAWQHIGMTPFKTLIGDRGALSLELLNDLYNHGYRHLIEKWCALLQRQGVVFDCYYQQKIKDFAAAADVFDSGTMTAPHDFIEYIENYQVNLSTTGDSVQIMTIHAAKGLGFDVVFLPDLKGNNSIAVSTVNGLQVKNDAECSPEWVFLMPPVEIGRKLPVISEFIEEKCKDSCYEDLCLLYVAITRAAKGLYMIIDKSSTGTVYASTILEKTLGGEPVDKTGISEVKTGEWLYRHGNADWFTKYALKENKEPAAASVSLNISFADCLQSSTPSGREPYITYGRNLFSGSTSHALALGTAVHELFEGLEWADSADHDEVLRKWLEKPLYDDTVLNEAGDIFISSLKNPDIFNALSRPVPEGVLWREKNFCAVMAGNCINGSFDRVVLSKSQDGSVGNAVIIDYKTDQIESQEDLRVKTEIYRKQMDCYTEVLAGILQINASKITRKLLFLRSGKVVELP